jgi:hypothetical protein
LSTEETDHFSWMLGSVPQRIGSSRGLFGKSTTQCLGGFSGHLRCYSDSLISYTAITEACDFVTGQGEMTPSRTISIYPNPAQAVIRVESPDEDIVAYRVSAMNGQTLLDKRVTPSSIIQIDLGHLPQGLYVVGAFGMNGAVAREKVIKLNGQ